MCWSHQAFMVNKKPGKGCACVCIHTSMPTKKQNFTQQHQHPHTHRLPMRQMRSERSHIKQPNLSCFAFIAPIHFHNALKPPLRREGDMERKKMRRVVGGRRERDGSERRGDKKYSQSNLTLVDIWGCKETR